MQTKYITIFEILPLVQWDQEVVYKSIVVADGGFYKFCITYPMHTTYASYTPKSLITPNLYPTLDGIEYPSVDDMTRKPKQNEPIKYIPRVDRTSKPMPGQKPIGNAMTPIDPITLAREKEMIYDEALKKEKEVLTIGNELKRFVSTSSVPSDVDKTEWYHKQSELEYKFIQKENELNDTICELNSVDQLEVENQLGTLQIYKQNPEMTEINARLEAKRKEFSQNERAVKETKQEVESKMNIIREQQKRHLQVSFSEILN